MLRNDLRSPGVTLPARRAEPQTPSVARARGSATLPRVECPACPRLVRVEHHVVGGLAVVCGHARPIANPDDVATLQRLLRRVSVDDVRTSWFVAASRCTGAACLTAHAPPEARWVVITTPDRYCEGLVDLSRPLWREGATAADVMTTAFVSLPVCAPLQEALDAIALGAPVVVAVDAHGRTSGLFDTRTLCDWLEGILCADSVDAPHDGRYAYIYDSAERG